MINKKGKRHCVHRWLAQYWGNGGHLPSFILRSACPCASNLLEYSRKSAPTINSQTPDRFPRVSRGGHGLVKLSLPSVSLVWLSAWHGHHYFLLIVLAVTNHLPLYFTPRLWDPKPKAKWAPGIINHASLHASC